MPLDFERLWALAALLALIPLYRWHRRALLAGGRPFSAYFLAPGDDGDLGRRGRVARPLLFAARAAALVLLALAMAGPRVALDRGEVVIAAGPVGEAGGATIIRAGRPPTVEDPGDFPPVLGRPDWGAALALAREVAPAARLRFVAGDPGPRVLAGGAALDGDAVVVTAAVTGGAPALVAGGARRAMTERAGDWIWRGALPPGPARIELDGADPWPLCIPDASPLPVADAGWPPAVEALLRTLPGVARVPAERAAWIVGPAPPPAEGRALFAPEVTRFEFATRPTREAAPLWFAGPLPPPGAIARRWRPLADPGTPILYAGDAVVADHRVGPAGAARRFGFDPADTDLPATAGWPVLFVDALEADRAARGRCAVHRADEPLVVAADGPVTVTDPRGATRVYPARDGAARIDGLDALGHATLEGPGGARATVAVVPGRDPAPPIAGEAPPRAGRPLRAALIGPALALLLIALFLAGRRPGLAGIAAVVVAATGLWIDALPLPGAPSGRVALWVDTGPSMPPDETRAAAAEAAAALGPRLGRRLMSAPTPWRDPAELGPFDPTAVDPFAALHAAPPTVAGDAAVVLLSDGLDPGLPRDLGVPVIAAPVRATRPDARVLDAAAVQLGERVFVRATVIADRAAEARVTLRIADEGPEAAVDVRLRAERPQSVQAVLPAPAGPGRLDAAWVEVRVTVPDDRRPQNDALPAPIEGERPPQAVVVGPAAAAWALAGGLRPVVVPAGALGETGARLAQARAMVIHEQPADRLDPALLDRLGRWVEAGGVLLLAGRTAAFGPGGWRGTALDALSPLTADPRPPGTGRVAVALLLDRSGSMSSEAGGPGIAALGRLAGSVAAGLRAADLLAVFAFGGEVEALLPPTEAGALARVPAPTLARGGTRLAPGLARARDALVPLPAEVRVAVVVGDGRVADPEAAIALGPSLAEAGVRVLSALVGPDPDPAVAEALAAATDGGVVRVEGDRLGLSIAAGLLDAAAGAGPAAGGPVTAEAGWPGRVGGVPPPVEGRVRVGARDGARVLARVAGDPLLAEWSVGQGRVLALATDRWALDAEQWATLLAPATAPRPGDVQLTVEGDRLVYRGPVAEPPPTGALRIRDEARVHRAQWRPEAPGVASAPLPEGPPAVLEVSAATARGAVVAPVVRPPSAALRRSGVDRGVLAAQAALTGGALVEAPADVAAAVDRLALPRRAPWPPIAAALAALLLLAEVRRRTGAR